MSMRMSPVRAKVLLSDGSEAVVPDAQVSALFDALDSRTSMIGPPDVEEGAWFHPDTLGCMGGRSEFERGRQRQILSWLADNRSENAPKVMLLGDGTRMRMSNGTGYAIHAYRRLIGKVNIEHVPQNCGGTIVGRKLIGEWLKCKPDIVHYNAGLQDLAKPKKESAANGDYVSVDTYKENLSAIFTEILSSGVSKLIWALSTPVYDEWHATQTRSTGVRRLARHDADVQAYNDASLEVAKEFGLTVNDLYSPLMEAGLREALLPDGVHLSARGSRLLGRQVAEMVEQAAVD